MRRDDGGRSGRNDGGRARDGTGPPPGYRLPAFASLLLGRERDVDEVARRLRAARLLTITGPGGIGKTRLGVEVARRTAPGHACFVDLAPLSDERLVAERVAAAFGLGELRGRDLAALLDAALTAETLLVLDNCEHVADACGDVARRLLLSCGHVRILATSQQRLGVPSEIEWVVPPLKLPEPGVDVEPEHVERCAALQLFCERAVTAKPDFVLAASDVGAIAEICRRLDANPLAIELAAARVRTLTPAEIAARLERRFQVLCSWPGITEGRHESLAAALTWSHDLLSGPEKVLLRRLSVFSGTFGFDAVEEVCAGGEVDRGDVLELLSALIAKSLVSADTSGRAARYRLAETVRLYAADRLATAGEATDVGERHAGWCMRIVEEAAEGGRGAPARHDSESEVDNVRSALEWCVVHERAEMGLRLATGHMRAWEATGSIAEAREWIRRVLTISDGACASLRARALYGTGFAALLLGDLEAARRDVEASIAASRQAGDPPSLIVRAEGLLAMVLTFSSGPIGVDELETALVGARASDDRTFANALVGCGHARLFRGEPVAAGRYFEELVAVTRRSANASGLATGLVGLGAAELAQGDCSTSREHLREGVAVAADISDGHTEVIGKIWLAELARLTGDAGGARVQLEECLAHARLTGSPYPLALTLLGLGRVALDQRDAEAARRHLEAALDRAQDARLGHIEVAVIACLGEAALVGDDRASAETLFARARAAAERSGEKSVAARATYHLADAARARGDVDRAVALHHDALRRFHDVGARPGVADSLDALAGLAVDGDRLELAARLFGAAAGLRHAGGWARLVGPHDRYERDVAQLRERMDRDEFEAAWAAGGALRCVDAVAYASRGRGRRTRAKEGPDSLTRAERQVVALAVGGLTTGEIADRLFISPRTVHSHLGRVYAKLGVASRRELRRRARELPPP